MCSQECAWCACAGTQCKDDNLLSCSSTQYFGEIPTRLLSSSCRGVVCVARCAVCRQNDTESSQQPPLFWRRQKNRNHGWFILIGVCVCGGVRGGGGGGEPEDCVSVHALHNNQISNLPPPGLVTTPHNPRPTECTHHSQKLRSRWTSRLGTPFGHCTRIALSLSLPTTHPHRSLSSPHNVHLTATSTATCSPRSSPALPHSPA